jgi:hypothetical protein
MTGFVFALFRGVSGVIGREKREVLGGNLLQSHFIHQKSYTGSTEVELVPPA